MLVVKKPLFKLGRLLATPGAIEALNRAGQTAWELVARHVQGDWGVVDDEDKALNDDSVKDGSRILSAYILKDGHTRLWILTEAEDDQGNRAATTCLLASEY